MDCGYNSNRSNNVKLHEEICKIETTINAKLGYQIDNKYRTIKVISFLKANYLW